MTNEEAIEVLKEDNTYIAFESYVPKSCFYEDSSDEIKNMAINAMEKQVAKFIDIYSDGFAPDASDVWEFHCPDCGREMDENEFRYCPDCGQKIDWRDEG